MTLSFQTRLILFSTLTFALLLAVVSAVSYRLLARQLDLDASADLAELTNGFHGYLRFDHGAPTIVFDANDADQAAFVAEATQYYQIYDSSDGKLLARSQGMEPLGLHLTAAEVRAYLDDPRPYDIQTAYGRFRISNSTIAPASGGHYLVQIAASLDDMDGALARDLDLMFWYGVPTLIVALLSIAWMAHKALMPLSTLATEASQITIGTLDTRLSNRGTGDQLDALAASFNETLARLEDAIGQMQQFSSALAHELRTPLTALRGEIEMALLQPRTDREWRASAASQIEEIDKLTRLVNQLLTLARAEAGEIPLARQTVDLSGLAATVTDQLEPVAQAGDLTLQCVVREPVSVSGDGGWLERVLLNVLDNAIKYTPAGGSVTVSVSREHDQARIDVRDTGAGVAPEALPHIFERFYRGDPARSSTHQEGAGLGLSLAKWIVDRHSGRIDVESEAGRGSTFTIRIPINSN